MPRLPILVASLFLPTALLVAQTTPVQYGYDAAGNMTSALPDGILSISYNNLNLPETVVLSSGNTRRIEQLYSAGGDKLGRDCYDQSGARVSHRSYVGPLVLEDGVPVMLLVDGGYISIGTQNGEYSGDYHFFVGDHQGNVRAVVGEDGTIEQTAHYDPFGEMAVDNLSINRYLYSGKEWDLNQQAYDFGARMYMPAYSRFTTIDPLCEQDYRTSPYAFCRNNPVNLVDPDGREWYSYNDGGEIKYKYFEKRLGETEEKRQGLKDMGYSFHANGKYYSLFGSILEYGGGNGNVANGDFCEVVDKMVIKYCEYLRNNSNYRENPFDAEVNTGPSIDYTIRGLKAGVYSFVYQGQSFSSLRDGTVYNAIDPKGRYVFGMHVLGDKYVKIWLFPSSGLFTRGGIGQRKDLQNKSGYFIVARPRNEADFDSFQVRFDKRNADAFLKACSNTFGVSF